jgi:glycosyltransferase involved in cell wall biosynthesis
MAAVVLVSKAMRHHPRLAGRTLPNMRVVLNGVAGNGTDPALKETATAEDLDRSIIDFCRGSYVVGSIGRLSVEKGYPYLIEALHLLIQRGIDAKLVIIGEGDEGWPRRSACGNASSCPDTGKRRGSIFPASTSSCCRP